jgi:hypothetical protein
MRTIELDASAWEIQQDFIDALKAAIGAPDWHGSNFIAFGDSMIGGGINALKPPYVIKVVNADHLSREVIDLVSIFSMELDRARSTKRFRTGDDVPVSFEFDRAAALGAPTAMNDARLIVETWKQVGNLASLPPHLVDNLAERIERAIRTRSSGIRPKEIEAAARVLHEAGSRHNWWKPHSKSYDEMAATDPIAKSEFDGIVERMLTAARGAAT